MPDLAARALAAPSRRAAAPAHARSPRRAHRAGPPPRSRSGAPPCLIPFSSCASPTPPRTRVPRRRATCSSASSPRRCRRRARRAGVRRGSRSARLPSPPPRSSPSPRFPAATPRPGRSGRASPSARSPRPRRSRTRSPTRRRPPSRAGNPRTESYDKLRQWQYGDRMHNFMETRQPRGEWVYEHDQNGATFRTLMHNDKGGNGFPGHPQDRPGLGSGGARIGLQGRRDDPGGHVPRSASAARRTWGRPRSTASARTRTAPSGFRNACRPASPSTTSIPRRRSHSAAGRRSPASSRTSNTARSCRASPGRDHVTTTVDRYDHLEPTPENLKLLDAPNIDAAQRNR